MKEFMSLLSKDVWLYRIVRGVNTSKSGPIPIFYTAKTKPPPDNT